MDLSFISAISPIAIPGIIGAFLCALEHPFAANLIWMFSNLIMAGRSWRMGDYTVAFSYLVFQLFATYGVARHLWNSRKKKIKSVKGTLDKL